MGSPRPSFGRAKNYDSKGRFEYGRLGDPRLGLNNLNSYTLRLLLYWIDVQALPQSPTTKLHC